MMASIVKAQAAWMGASQTSDERRDEWDGRDDAYCVRDPAALFISG